MGSGKAQPAYSKVMTEWGYKKIGNLKIGDTVYGENGELHKILGVFPQGKKDIYEITFSDGSKVRSCDEHLWTYQLPQDKSANKFRTNTLNEIMKLNLYKTTNRGDKNWQIFVPLTKPLKMKEIELEIDAYAMGALLGDGGFTGYSITFTNNEYDVVEKLQSALGKQYKLSEKDKNNYIIVNNQLIDDSFKGYNNLLKFQLSQFNLLGVHSNKKFIPKQYLFNSVNNRIKVLQGLIDTDGEVEANNVYFSTTSSQLSRDVQFLVHSLGGTCKITNRQTYYTYKGKKKAGLPSYRLYIKMPSNILIFTSEKHKLKYKKGNTEPCRSMRSIKYIGKEECVCIYIDNPNHLYLTDDMVVTHNTTWAINKIKSEPENKFVYITPYLDEIKRVKDTTYEFNRMYEPMFRNSTKHENLHKLLREGKNVCSTHALFRKSNHITRQALSAHNYILILDEVMNVVEELPDFTSDDLNTLMQEQLAYIEDDFLLWSDDKLDYDGRYNDIKNMAINNNLVVIGNKVLYWNFPVDIFNYFSEVYVLTYMFDAQIQKYYYDFYNINYDMFQVQNGVLVDFKPSRDFQQRLEMAKLINIYKGNLNSIGDEKYSLSVNWYKQDDGTLQGILKNHLYNWFNNINRGVSVKYRLWTTFKNYKSNLKGKGYTNRFVSSNIRATNQYRDTYILAYTCNKFIKPTINIFFKKRNITINQDLYALSEMLQWIWRSRIREGKSINIYIPSKRMRKLLIDYLQPKIENQL